MPRRTSLPASARRSPESSDPGADIWRLRRQGRLRDALTAASRAIDLLAAQAVPSDRLTPAVLLLERGELHVLLGDDHAADDDLAAAALLAGRVDPAIAARAIAGRIAIARFEGRLSDADALTVDAVAIVKKVPALDPIVRSIVLRESGLCRLDRDDRRAIRDLTRAVHAAEAAAAGPTRNATLGLALDGRATARRVAGDFHAARADLDRALPLARRGFGRSSLEVAQILNDRGVVAKFAGDFDRADADYRHAAMMIRELVGADHPEMAALLHNVAGVAHARGDFAAAEGPARQSLDIRIHSLGDDHIAVALDRAGLASILDRLGRPDEAEALLLTALDVIRRRLGPTHREVAMCLNNLAAIAQGRGDLEAAERLYREALAIKVATLGRASPSVGITLSNLAAVVRRRGDPVEAATLAARAVEILRRTVGSDHPARRAAEANRRWIDSDPGRP